MVSSRVSARIRRYTDLPSAIHLLMSKKITLLDPKTWDDKNDSFFMSVYKDRKCLKSLLALCFSQSRETYHHWRVFSNGPAGVCIVFDKEKLLEDIMKEPAIITRKIDYIPLTQAKKMTFCVNNLPFVKRYGFKPENEFRVVYTSTAKECTAFDLPIRISSISRISLSPWMHNSLSDSTRKVIRSIDGCAKLKVLPSTLISNEHWKRYGSGAT